ncbi:MAG: outer membrane beta-barrel protein [Pseudomonadota bacterium]
MAIIGGEQRLIEKRNNVRRQWWSIVVGACACFATLLSLQSVAHAQLFKYGPLTIASETEAALQFDSNVFRSAFNPRSDTILITRQGLTLEYARARGTTELKAGVTSNDYTDLQQNSFVNGNASLQHSHELTPLWKIVLSGSVALSNQLPGEPDTDVPDTAAEPIQRITSASSVALEREMKRGKLSFGVNYQNRDYNDVRTIDGGIADQDFRDTETVRARTSIEHNFSSRLQTIVFFEASVDEVRGRPNIENELDRDATRYEAGITTSFAITSKLELNLQFSALDERFHDERIGDQGLLPTYEASLKWSPFQIATLGVTWQRSEEGVNFAEGGATGTSEVFSFAIDITPTSNLQIGITGSTNESTFDDGDTILRNNFDATLEYSLNRHTTLSLGYSFTERDSSTANDSFSRDVFRLSAKAEF